MAGFEIIHDQSFPLSFEGFLFNEPDQVAKQSCSFHTFYLTDKNYTWARFVLFIDKEEGKSPFRAPFGSVEFHPALPYEPLVVFLQKIETFCRDKNLKKLSIVSYPFCYAPTQSHQLSYILTHQGFCITTSDLNFHMDITGRNFEELLHESEKRRLKKCLKENFSFKTEATPDLTEMYDLIKRNRENKGYPLSMKLEELEGAFRQFPDNYLAFTLRDGKKLVVSSIGVKVNSKILYYFLPAADAEYKNFSPMVALLKGMFDFCKKNDYALLDLGIATSNGVPNEGLIRFKENLGAQPSLKLSFSKELI